MMIKKHHLHLILFLATIFFVCCKHKEKSELAELPCVVIKAPKNNILIGDYYSAELMLLCDRPKKISQMKIEGRCSCRDCNNKEEEYNNSPKFYFKNNRIFCKYYCETFGKKYLSGLITIEREDGKKDVEYFQDSFYVSYPFSAIESCRFNYLIVNDENPISIGVPNFRVDELIVTAKNAEIKKWSDNRTGHYIVKPLSKNVVSIFVSGNVDGDTIFLGEFKFRVIDKDKN